MTAQQKYKAQLLFTKLEQLKAEHKNISDPYNFWDFLKSWKFWWEVAKIIFKLLF